MSGAELKKHTDREQCEFSVTLCLDFSPEPKLATPWPIQLDTSAGTVAAYQALGDGLVYRGTRVPHYRCVAPGHTSTSLFFHYVPVDFQDRLIRPRTGLAQSGNYIQHREDLIVAVCKP